MKFREPVRAEVRPSGRRQTAEIVLNGPVAVADGLTCGRSTAVESGTNLPLQRQHSRDIDVVNPGLHAYCKNPQLNISIS